MLPGYIHHIVQSQTETGYFLLLILIPGNDAFKLIKYNPLNLSVKNSSISGKSFARTSHSRAF
mgnify:CR=1 FL=1